MDEEAGWTLHQSNLAINCETMGIPYLP